MSSLGTATHLTRRFLWSLRRDEPDGSDEEWLLALCSAREKQLYHASSRQDRRHAIDCARRAQALLDEATGTATTNEPADGTVAATPRDRDDVIVAAALHDVGKTPARLSTIGRVAATLAGPFVAERRDFVAPANLWQRFGIYKAHPTIGAELLAGADSAPLVVAWAQQHHWHRSERTIDASLDAILAQAD